MTISMVTPTASTMSPSITPIPRGVAVDSAAQPSKLRRQRMRFIVGAVLATSLAVEATLVLPLAARALPMLSHLRPDWVVLALLAQLVSMAAFARVQRRMLAASGIDVPHAQMLAMIVAANAVNATLPAGAIVSTGYTFRRLRRWGASPASASFVLFAAGALSSVSFAALAVTGALAMGASGASAALLAIPGVILCAAVAIGVQIMRRPERVIAGLTWVVRAGSRLARRDPNEGQRLLVRVAERIPRVRVGRSDWAVGLSFAAMNWAADLGCLGASCRAVGLHAVGTGWVLAAYLAGMSISALPLLPGGIGTVEAAMVLALVHGGVSAPLATAAVVLYRSISFLLVVLIGWMLWAFEARRSGNRLGVPERFT